MKSIFDAYREIKKEVLSEQNKVEVDSIGQAYIDANLKKRGLTEASQAPLLEYYAKGTIGGVPFSIATDDVYDAKTIHGQNPHLSPSQAAAIELHTNTDDFIDGNCGKSNQKGHVVSIHTMGGYSGDFGDTRNTLRKIAARRYVDESLETESREDILLENRIDYIKKNVGTLSTEHDPLGEHKETGAIIDYLSSFDPSPKKTGTSWLVGLYKAGKLKQEDAYKATVHLGMFNDYKSKLPLEQRELNVRNYPSLSSLANTVVGFQGAPKTKAEGAEQLKQNPHIEGKHDLRYEDDKIKLFELTDKETSKKLYDRPTNNPHAPFPTEWCTATSTESHNRWDHYTADYPGHVPFIVHRKSDGAVFQYHTGGDGEFMDHENDVISSNDFESIRPSLWTAWKQDPRLGEGKQK